MEHFLKLRCKPRKRASWLARLQVHSGFNSMAQSDGPDWSDMPAAACPASLRGCCFSWPWTCRCPRGYPSATFHPLLAPSTPAPLGENGPPLLGSPLHPGFICSQFTWPACVAKFNLLSLRAQKRSKNKTGSCCLHFESIVSDTELQKNSPGTVQTREKMLFAVNCLNSIDYPTLVPI